MNIKVEKLITDGDVAYKILSIDKCCDKIIDSAGILINTEVDENNPDFNYENPEYSVKLCNSEINYDDEWSEAAEVDHYEKINFCPFCGEPIVMDIVSERDMTEEYNKLCKEANKIRELIFKTDSKKEEGILKLKLKEIQNQKRTLIIDDDFTKEE